MKRVSWVLKSCMLGLCLMGFVFGQNWKVDQQNARVNFEIGSIHGTVKGSFKQVDTRVIFNPEDLAASKISGKIKVNSIETGIGARDNGLKASKYFDADKYPHMTFSSKKIVREGGQYVAYGTMSIKGESREFKLPFSFEGNKFKATFNLKFTDYDVSGGGFMHEDDVKVKMELGAVKG